jgi:benzodiazapine receptor
MSASSFLSLLAFLALNMIAAASGALFRPGAWHRWLKKPSWNPPNWLFAPAWSVLYLMIAVAGWRVFDARGWAAAPELTVYFISLCLNAGWSGLFFGLKKPGVAFVELLGLWASIAIMIAMFMPIDSVAAWLLVPYLCWVTFAGALNFSIWRLNRGRTGAPTAA